jgi:hypothetical protein
MMRTDRRDDDKGPGPSPAGRPRDGNIDAPIIQATRELLLETGYPTLPLSAIASRAGTTTAALYRRWSGKARSPTCPAAWVDDLTDLISSGWARMSPGPTSPPIYGAGGTTGEAKSNVIPSSHTSARTAGR